MSQIQAGGTYPSVGSLFVGALMWSAIDNIQAASIAAMVVEGDFRDTGLGAVFTALQSLVLNNRPFSPQLVLDELRRTGEFNALTERQLQTAVTSGATPEALRECAAAMVADSFRSRAAGLGEALIEFAKSASDDDVAFLVGRVSPTVTECHKRLSWLRGES